MIFSSILSSLFRQQAICSEVISTRCFFSAEAYNSMVPIVWLPGNKPCDQLASNSVLRLLIDVITNVESYDFIIMMVLR